MLATLHEAVDRPLLLVAPEDEDARDVAEAVAWYADPARVALLPSRGVGVGSGLEPPAHLVGERARALAVLAEGGFVAASARALAEGMPPPRARAPVTIAAGDELGLDGLVEQLTLAGYERVDRVEERGQIAVRGGLVDVFPSTGREPLRVELFGDEIEQVRAFSPFTQRTLHAVDEAVIYPAAERRSDVVEPTLPDDDDGASAGTRRPRPAARPPARSRLAAGRRPPRLGGGRARSPALARPGRRARPVPARAAALVRGTAPGDRGARAGGGGDRARRDAPPGRRVLVAFPHKGEALRTERLLRKVEAEVVEEDAPLPEDPELRFVVSPARRGFVWRDLGIALLPDAQVFRKRPPRADARLGRALQSFADLRTGDYVVHEDHGIGRLLGFETQEVAGVTRDYLYLAFKGEDRLYVPHEQLPKVSRYIGADASAPSLSKLGGKAWQNLKSRTRASVRELAGELLALYAQRQQAPGFAFDLDQDWLERLEASFPYRETDDQLQAIEAVKEDLEAPRPMDRLVCGDVGFGKTEVAVRAAFAAALNGKQTLVLCPTTILAEQHWNTFRERYRDFPIRVEMVSRFRTRADQKRILDDFAAGKVEVLIGTHRLLSRDVIPKELGLVILDEEQRFGVAQKELIRSLRLEVDVLALSATPIPRTLHMSLSGLRDISIIETPPQGRRPIRTTVGEYDEELVNTALEREHARGGQAFYLHNRVESIDEAAEKLRQLLPQLRVLVAHGQMSRARARGAHARVPAGDADVLVSTTIIESGHRHPAGEHADRRAGGRARARPALPDPRPRRPLGRPRPRLPAYPEASELSPEARARLSTLADHTELGAGFQIAMRDLEIRGAGDLLGPEQSGHVAALGFELYVEMLNEAVAELSGQRRDRRPAGARRRAGRRVRPGLVHRGGGAEDRPPSANRARRGRGRAARAPSRSPKTGTGRCPSPSRTCSRSRRRSSSSRGSARTTSSTAAAARRSARSHSRRSSFSRSEPPSRPRSTRRRSAKSRSAPRISSRPSTCPML